MAQKFIESDIVMYGNQIMVIKEPKDGSHFDLLWHKRVVYSNIGIEDIKPVPLTHEILEKNGWKRLYNDSSFWFNDNIGDSAEFEEFNGHFSPKIFKLPIIHYVHQLQHYFFGLGIKIEIKV